METNSDQPVNAGLEAAAQLLHDARCTVVFTGAGISTPSGIPDFRSATGLWTRDDPLKTASLSTFRRDPARFWAWKGDLLRQIWASAPNPAHRTLARWEQQHLIEAVITQNIDGFHQAAGSRVVLELHGSVRETYCPACGKRWQTSHFQDIIRSGELPRCPQDQHVVRPDVVLFEEMLPTAVFEQAEALAMRCDLLLVAGSSLSVYPAAGIPQLALQSGSRLIILNRDPTPLDSLADVVIPGDLAETLPRLADLVASFS